jgi:hypothetical protein
MIAASSSPEAAGVAVLLAAPVEARACDAGSLGS